MMIPLDQTISVTVRIEHGIPEELYMGGRLGRVSG